MNTSRNEFPSWLVPSCFYLHDFFLDLFYFTCVNVLNASVSRCLYLFPRFEELSAVILLSLFFCVPHPK